VATTPERFLRAVTAASPIPAPEAPRGTRAAFEAALDFFNRARTSAGEPLTFLLDEFLELRTFESFPGLRRVVHDFINGITASGTRFVLRSRYVFRTLRLLRDHSSRFEVINMPALSLEDTLDVIGISSGSPHDAEYTARSVQALTDGRPAYVRLLAEELAG